MLMQPPHPCLVTGEAEAKVTLNELALRVLLRGRKVRDWFGLERCLK